MSIDLRTCDPNALPASAELDALMATGVMDKTLLTEQEMQTEAELVLKHQPQCVHFLMGFSAWKDVNEWKFDQHIPPYSTNPAHAGELMMTATISSLHMGMWRADVNITIADRVYIGRCVYSETEGDKGKAAALAICRAFAAMLKAKAERRE